MSFWDRYAAVGYDALRVIVPYRQLQRELLDLAALGPGERLLVAGCGTGYFERLALDAVPDLVVEAVDSSPVMLARARAGAPRARHQLTDLCAPLPFADGQFDAAVMSNVLYALPDGPAALAEVARCVRPGGRFVCCDRLPGSYFSHVRRAHFRAINALPPGARLAAWARTLALAPALLGVSAANMSMKGKDRSGQFHCYALEDATALLRTVGFTTTASCITYAGQCWLLRALRELPAPG